MAQARTKSTRSAGSTRASRGSNGTRAASRTGRSNGSNRTKSATTSTRTQETKRKPPKRAAASKAPKSEEAPEQRQERTVGDVLSKAKTPLLAGGAAAAGLVGGIALSRSGKNQAFSIPKFGGKRKRMPSISMPRIPKPQLAKRDTTTGKALGATAKALGNTAVEIGKAGYRVGELTAVVRRVREQARND